jgi:hypothetical protein
MSNPVLDFYRKNFNPDLTGEQEEMILSGFRQGDPNTRH